MEAQLAEGLYRIGVAFAIGAFVGLERQARLETGLEDGPPEVPDGRRESEVRAAIAAGEASRVRDAAPTPPRPALDESGESIVPDFQQAAGLRTFSLIGLSGAIAGSFSSPLVFVAAFAVLGGLILASYLASQRRQGDLGLTSEIAGLAVFLLGGMCADGQIVLASTIGVGIAFLLSIKRRLHGFARRLRQEDLHAVIKFAALTIVIMPLLPEEPVVVGRWLPGRAAVATADAPAAAAPPGDAPASGGVAAVTSPGPVVGEVAAVTSLTAASAAPPVGEEPWWRELSVNLRKIWLMVILISGISFAGYVLGQTLGTGRGLIVTGVVGGLVSSTAVSLTYSQRSQQSPELSPQLAIGILLANAIMPVRLLVVVGVISTSLVVPLAAPLLLTAAVGGLASLVIYLRQRGESGEHDVQLKNPFEVGPALQFGLLFGVVLFLAQVVQRLFGEAGLYGLAVLTGLTDVDAIGLAMADVVRAGEQTAAIGAITITLAVISNTLVKGGFVVGAGAPQLRRVGTISFGLMVLGAICGVVIVRVFG